MITAQVESLTENLEDLKSMFPDHYRELALNQDKVPLDPQYDIYLARDAAGQVMYVTLRKDGELIGYLVAFIAPGLHYRTCLTCTTDIFFIHPDYRDGSPGPAIKLFRAAQKEAKRRGVDRWFVGSKVKHDASRLFEYLGFEKVETHYSLYLGD